MTTTKPHPFTTAINAVEHILADHEAREAYRVAEARREAAEYARDAIDCVIAALRSLPPLTPWLDTGATIDGGEGIRTAEQVATWCERQRPEVPELGDEPVDHYSYITDAADEVAEAAMDDVLAIAAGMLPEQWSAAASTTEWPICAKVLAITSPSGTTAQLDQVQDGVRVTVDTNPHFARTYAPTWRTAIARTITILEAIA